MAAAKHKSASHLTMRGLFPSFVLLLTLTAIQVWNPGAVQAIRLKTFDFFQRSEPATVPADATLIVDIDDASLTKVGQWPWDRATMAELVSTIAKGKPKSIGLDIVFAEADRLAPKSLKERLDRVKSETKPDLSWLSDLPDTDKTLATAVRNAPIISAIAAAPIIGPNPLPRSSVASIGGDPLPWLPQFVGGVSSLPAIADAAKATGNITIEPGIDGVVRQLPMLLNIDSQVLPALSLEMMAVGEKAKTVFLRTRTWGVTEAVAGERSVKLDGTGRIWIRYAPHNGTRFISAASVIEGKIDPAVFAGRNVLVGSSAFGLWDIRATPLGYSMPGVEIQAQALDGILHGSHLIRPYWTLGFEVLATLLAGLMLLVLSTRIGAKWLLVALIFVTLTLLTGSYLLFENMSLLLDGAYPAICATVLCLALIHEGHARSEIARENITGAFKKYLSPDLVERLAKDSSKLNLGGEAREITVLFADIQGFTPLSEKLKNAPERLTRLINMLLDRMSESVLAEGGTIDKFMGDNVMAFWNAPIETKDHASRACRAAIGMQRALANLNAELAADPDWADVVSVKQPLAAGIGINTGTCVVGNFGSRHRFDYSAIGDAVNLASRLEGAAKRYSVAALVTGHTIEQTTNMTALLLGPVHVRGRQEPVDAYALIDSTASRETLIAGHDRFMKLDAETAASRQVITDLVAAEPRLEILYETLSRERQPKRQVA